MEACAGFGRRSSRPQPDGVEGRGSLADRWEHRGAAPDGTSAGRSAPRPELAAGALVGVVPE